MRRLTFAIAFMAIAISGFTIAYGPTNAVAWVTTTTDNPGASNEKVTICHHVEGKGETGYGFNVITVNFNSIADAQSVGGHGDHAQDIIPPYTYTDPQGTVNYPGKGDQPWLANGCKPPGETTTTTTTSTTTETTTTEPTTTETTTTSTTTTTPEPPCKNGEPPIHGQNGDPGNDVCDPCAPPVNLEKCPGGETTSTTTTDSTETTTTSTTPTTPSETTPGTTTTPPKTTGKPPKPSSKPKPTSNACPKGTHMKNGTCYRNYHGKPHAVIMGQG